VRSPLLDALAGGSLAPLAQAASPYLRALATVLPAATLVPALSVRGLPTSARFAVALALALPLAAAFTPAGADASLPLLLATDALRGVPLAVVLATPLWAATHVGALADQLRGVPDVTQAPPPGAEGARGPLATLTAMLAASVWLSSGGLVRGLLLLAKLAPGADSATAAGAAGAASASAARIAPWALAARTLTDALRLSVALASSVIVAALALEVALAAIARAGAPISSQPIAYVARPLVAVIALAASLDVAMRLVG
jgi:type III secretory pathway component EscT